MPRPFNWAGVGAGGGGADLRSLGDAVLVDTVDEGPVVGAAVAVEAAAEPLAAGAAVVTEAVPAGALCAACGKIKAVAMTAAAVRGP